MWCKKTYFSKCDIINDVITCRHKNKDLLLSRKEKQNSIRERKKGGKEKKDLLSSLCRKIKNIHR